MSSDRKELEPFEFGGKFDSGYEQEAERAIESGQISAWDSFNMVMGDVMNYVKMGGDFKNPFKGGGATPSGDLLYPAGGAEGPPLLLEGAQAAEVGAGGTSPIDQFTGKMRKMTGEFKPGDTREMFNPQTQSWTLGEFTTEGVWIDPSAGNMPLPEITAWNYQDTMRPQEMKKYTDGELSSAWQTFEQGMPLSPLNKMSMAPGPFQQYNPSQPLDYMQMMM